MHLRVDFLCMLRMGLITSFERLSECIFEWALLLPSNDFLNASSNGLFMHASNGLLVHASNRPSEGFFEWTFCNSNRRAFVHTNQRTFVQIPIEGYLLKCQSKDTVTMPIERYFLNCQLKGLVNMPIEGPLSMSIEGRYVDTH